jgi:hypothetical protein
VCSSRHQPTRTGTQLPSTGACVNGPTHRSKEPAHGQATNMVVTAARSRIRTMPGSVCSQYCVGRQRLLDPERILTVRMTAATRPARVGSSGDRTTPRSSCSAATATASKTRAKTCSEPTRRHDCSGFDDRQPLRFQRLLTPPAGDRDGGEGAAHPVKPPLTAAPGGAEAISASVAAGSQIGSRTWTC